MSQFVGGKPGDGLGSEFEIGTDGGFTGFEPGETYVTDSRVDDGPEGDGMSKFVHDGHVIDYTPAADTPAATVVLQGDLIGVTRTAIAAGQLGSLAVEGVFDFAKATAAGSGFTVGALAYWDNTNKVATKTATGNKLIGKAVRAAADADATVRIRLQQ
jgi:predicted RecA/RadA family phage recombinase